MAVFCPYCTKQAFLVGGRIIYPHRPDLFEKFFYHCSPCDAYVGCHPGTINPLGRLADAELRATKSLAHKAFDPIWKDGEMTRTEAYAWLSKTLQINPTDCHIGMFDVDTCRLVIDACKSRTLMP